MRKTLTTILIGGLIAGAFLAVPAEAKKKKKYVRKAKSAYSVPAFGQADVGGTCPDQPELNGCARFSTSRKDRFVKVSIDDASGTTVVGTLSHPDQNGDGFVESLGYFCGSSQKVAIQPGADLIVFPYMVGSAGVLESFGGPPQCTGVGTQGTISAVFTSK